MKSPLSLCLPLPTHAHVNCLGCLKFVLTHTGRGGGKMQVSRVRGKSQGTRNANLCQAPAWRNHHPRGGYVSNAIFPMDVMRTSARTGCSSGAVMATAVCADEMKKNITAVSPLCWMKTDEYSPHRASPIPTATSIASGPQST